MENNRLDRNEIRASIFEIVNRMSDDEMLALLKELRERQYRERRKYNRIDFFTIIDYSAGDQYYRDFIQDMSNSGVFIKTSQKFSVGQIIRMTFMSRDYQKPFKINGEIVRASPDGIGVKFKIESQVQEEAIKSLIDII
ncbi:MAG: PilZ domain-containing protein [Desulfobacterales bacterium]